MTARPFPRPLGRLGLALGAVSLVAVSACTDPATGERSNARTGALIGAAAGGLFGLSRDGDAPAETLIGAAVGAGIGAAIGNELDKQARELRSELGGSGATVTNTGDQLVVTMPQDILFAVDSTTIRPDLRDDLAALAANLQRYPDTTVDVVGHTDNTGTASYNQNLSQRRAQAVTNVLMANGVAPARLRAIGRGEDAPIASNLTEEGRAQNRRVEIIIRPRA
jgi:outer membrane protein OmpA-like peptidoglycan-associated protein